MYLVEIQNIIIPSKSAILHHKHQNTRMRRQIAPMFALHSLSAITVFSLLRPPGGLFFSGPFKREGGLLERGA